MSHQPYRDDIEQLLRRYAGALDNVNFDAALLQLADRCLKRSRFITFYFAYRCEPSWKGIQGLYKSTLLRDLKIVSIQQYASDAQKRLRSEARKSSEMQTWLKKRVEQTEA